MSSSPWSCAGVRHCPKLSLVTLTCLLEYTTTPSLDVLLEQAHVSVLSFASCKIIWIHSSIHPSIYPVLFEFKIAHGMFDWLKG